MRETLVKTEDFKDSPVGRIPKDWELRKLTDIASYQNGKSFPSLDYSESGRPLLRPGNLPDDDFVLWDEAHTTYLPLKWAELAPDYIVLGEELVMNLTAQSLDDQFLGRVCMTPPDTFCLLNQRIARFRAKDCYLPFLFWALKGTYFRAQIDRIPQGTKVQHIYNSDLDAIILPMPKEQSEQRAITEILFTLSALVRSQESLIAKLKQMKAGLLHDLLTRGLDENGELRDAIGNPEQFKDSPLGQIPKDWEVESLDTVCLNVVDCPHTTPVFRTEGVLVARTSNIRDGIFDVPASSYISEQEYRQRITRLEPQLGDIVFTREAPVGEAFVIPEGMRICLGQRTMLLRPSPEKAHPGYLLAQIYSGAVRVRINQLVGGTTNPHLNVGEVRSFLLPVPPLGEQAQIASVLDTHNDYIRAEEAYRDKLKLQKKGLMHDLLTGKVRVKDADKFTPASDTV